MHCLQCHVYDASLGLEVGLELKPESARSFWMRLTPATAGNSPVAARVRKLSHMRGA
jgi:hypothetical protein